MLVLQQEPAPLASDIQVTRHLDSPVRATFTQGAEVFQMAKSHVMRLSGLFEPLPQDTWPQR